MIYQTTHYINPESKRQYRLELLGDLTVSAFYGSHRNIHYHATLIAAQHFYQKEHKRRIQRKYKVCDS